MLAKHILILFFKKNQAKIDQKLRSEDFYRHANNHTTYPMYFLLKDLL